MKSDLATVGGLDPCEVIGGRWARMRPRRWGASLAALGAAVVAAGLTPTAAEASCAAPANATEAENCLAGTPETTWSISGAGDASIQGFATDISVNRGATIQFKVKSTASAYRLDIYRMGYYQGNGARLVTTVNPSVTLPQTQPACLTNSTGLIDCGNWAVSASWAVPTTAASGIYFARAVRTDTGGASHIFFVVRNDASASAILYQTSDPTWHAYNDFGGNNLYTGNGAVGRAYKVSYNRPFNTQAYEAESWVLNAEYPMVRWLERNGYDVTYHTGVDADRSGALIRNHRVWMSSGHDEYWSGGQRANVEAARNAGVHLAFFSANKIFWKTRWENSIDPSGTAFRTLVCYKETHAGAVIDPQDPPTWTGTWRDPRFSPPADGGKPENALGGTLFMINGVFNGAYQVTQADGRMRFWRNTTVATLGAGQTATLAPGSIGAEVDVDLDNGFRPPGLFGVSTTPISTGSLYLQDYGSTYGAGTATQRITLYRHPSGALVFATGSYQWSWGLDANHDRTSFGSTTDVRMQQATVNLFADMGVQPATLQTGLVAATASTDLTAPTSLITSPAAGATVAGGSTVTISGTAADVGGGVVGGVEVSTDGGATWHPTTGREAWSYAWTVPGAGTWTLRSRAVDDSGNIETPSTGRTVTVAGSGPACTTNCFIWPSATVPALVDGGPDSPVELGVKFRSDVAGTISGVRFYKATANTGTHVGNLWSSAGTRLATATFAGETASGWQQVTFATPVAIAANTVYVASYFCPAGHYSADLGYFSGKGADTPPLHALADGVSGGDGVYAYGSTSSFPTLTWNTSNYWVDVVFTPTPTTSLVSIAVTPTLATVTAGGTQQFTATGSYTDGSTQALASGVTWASSATAVATVATSGLATAVAPGTASISATVGAVNGSASLVVQPAPLAITTAALPGATQYQAYAAALAASGGTLPYLWSITSGVLPQGLVLDGASGAISGSTTAVGTFPITVQVRDAAARLATANLSIVVAAAPVLAVATTSLPGGTQFAAYAATLAGTGGVPPYSWSIATGLPAGVSLNAASGALSGTPAVAGTFGFTVVVADAVGGTATRALSIAVAAAPALTITTVALPGGTVGAPYSAGLAGTGGALPYTWAVASGLPPGLGLVPASGTISGTPTTSGTYAFTVQVTDAAAQVTTKALSIAVASSATFTIWPAATVPGLVDGGPDSPVELGVKFRSDVAGFVKGIRFYKASANTGTHVANLWSSTGTKLATATFTGETASGWQQVLFATPLAVTANTVYVASYLCPAGHYSADLNYFSTAGVDSPPLHALQNGVSGGDGVYAYGATSSFPNLTWNASNYWVDVVFSAAPSAVLTSIALSPAGPTIQVGGTQAFTATGSYSDGSSQVLSTGLTWASSSPAIATVSSAGVAAGVARGTATISAASGAISGSTVVTVQPAPLAIATTTLPGGTQFQVYAATLAASGGTTPYAWSVVAGALPAGLSLNAGSGAITGTPSGSGTSIFTVQVADAGSQVVTKALSIAVTAAPALAITTTALASGTRSIAYSAPLAGAGGVPPYAWSIAAGLPPGLSLNASTGAIAGAPTTTGAFAFTVQLTDAASQTTSKALSITVNAPPALSITTTALPGGTQYLAYSAGLAASGGVAPLVWSVGTGLPAGLTLNASTGAIAGAPTGAGVFTITAQVTDAATQVATASLTITVAAAPALTITTATLPGGTVGSTYLATLAAGGGLAPYVWSILSGLPPTLTLNAATGVVSGTTTAAGAYSFSVQALDAASHSASKLLTINVVPPGSYSLWPSATIPVTADSGPDNSVEVGVQFKADQAGFIAGIRFYKAAANTGTHVANLWSSSGTKLATASFTAETASGWQQVNFASPVAITAGATYVASYHTAVGHYAADSGYFATNGWDNTPLHAPSTGTVGGNGVYAYGSTSGFPALTWNSTNYWVDVVFNPAVPVPTVSSIALTPGAATVAAGGTQQFTAVATYSDGSTVDVTREATWATFNAAVASAASGGLVSALIAGSTSVTATLNGTTGSAGLTVSAPLPPANEGPDGPILVISGAGNAFSRYLAEILRAEGLQEFLATDISFVTTATLAAHDLVILGDVPLTAAQASMLTTWVTAGGNLIAMHPDKQLAGLLGLADAGGTLANAYLLVDTATPAGTGIVGQTIQFHGSADLYNLSGAQALATLYTSATGSSGKPAVTLKSVGSGQAAAFTYDLARSVVLTRQGNPAWSGQQRDGLYPTRSDDLFFGASQSDPQADWIDLSKVAIPQADEQQRLLANLIIRMNAGKKPLPRFWYLPSGFKAAVVMTGDDHASGGTAGRWNSYIAASPAGCSVADWQCVRGTSYLYAVSPLTAAQATSFTSQGFEVALHPTTNCGDYSSYADLDAFYSSQLATFASQYPGLPAPRTSRTHCIVWSDFDTQPQVELARGIRLDTNYYFYPPGWVNDRPGFFTGSGWPMRFADRSGRTIDVYQAASQMTDESGQTFPMTINALLDGAVGPLGYYGVFTANMHTDQVASSGSDAIVASAKARGIPVVSALQMLQWLDGRNASSFGSLSWGGNALSFTVTAAAAARNLRALLPAQVGTLQIAGITMGGVPVTFTTQTIKGISYAVFPAATGSYLATYH